MKRFWSMLTTLERQEPNTRYLTIYRYPFIRGYTPDFLMPSRAGEDIRRHQRTFASSTAKA